MTKAFWVVLLLVFVTTPAFAQSQAGLCKLRTTYKPSDDVAFKPGVAANGKAVVPADLGGAASALSVPDKVRIPLTIDMAKNLGLPVPVGTEMQAAFGMLDIYNDGRVTYNGKDITSNAAAICDDKVPTAPVAPAAAKTPSVSAPAVAKPAAPAMADPVAINKPAAPVTEAVEQPPAPAVAAPESAPAETAPVSEIPAENAIPSKQNSSQSYEDQELNWGKEQ